MGLVKIIKLDGISKFGGGHKVVIVESFRIVNKL